MTGNRRETTRKLQTLMAGTSAIAILIGAFAGTALAQDATWLANPGSGNFNAAGNWTPATVPTGTAFFGTSATTALTFSSNTTIGGWTFNAGADDYTFTLGNNRTVEFIGAGIVANGGSATIEVAGGNSVLQFRNSSAAGSAVINNDAGAGGATVEFYDFSTAGSATITNTQLLSFFDTSTASSATIVNDTFGQVLFFGNSSAGDAIITISDLSQVVFYQNSTAGNSTITNDYGLYFLGSATAGTATITNNGQFQFGSNSTAGDATITNNALLEFYGASTAGDAIITNIGTVGFEDNSTADGATIVNNDASILTFSDTSTAGSATITNNDFGIVEFSGSSTAGSASITNNAILGFADDSSAHDAVIVNNVGVGAGDVLFFSDASTAGDATITNNALLEFYNNSTAGDATITNNALLEFFGNSTAGDDSTLVRSTITNNDSLNFWDTSSAGDAEIGNLGALNFRNASTAATSIITNDNGVIDFRESSTAGTATITNFNGSNVGFSDNSSADGSIILNSDGLVVFRNTSSAGDATITNDMWVWFFDNSTGGNARLVNNPGGEIDFSATTGPAGDGQISAGSIAGAGNYYLGSRTLTVGGNDDDTEVSGVISDCDACLTPGTGGSLVKVGTGTLTLSGVNTYTGDTTVDGGVLDVAGSLVSAVTVNSGTLAGIGTIGGLTLNNGGTLSPGNSIGTLTVAGDATFNAGSTYVVEVEAPDQADLLSVTGTATINGGAVEIVKLSPEVSYADGQTYRLIAAGTVVRNGDFTLNQPFLFLSAELDYGAGFVDLLLNAGGTGGDFTTVAQTFNQFQTASALNDLEQSGDALAVYNELLFLTDADEARRAFDLSSGEMHASGQQIIDQTFALFSRTLRGQASAGIGGGMAGGQVFTAPPLGYGPATGSAGVVAIDDATTSAYASERVANAWLAPLGGRGTIDADGNAGQLDWWTAGLAGGYEGPIDVASGNAWAGFGFGYMRSHGAVDARLSTLDADNFQIGVYGGWADGPWSLAGSLAYGASRIDTERRIVFGGIDRTAEADYWSHTIGFSGEALYGFDMGNGTTLSPLFTLDAGWSGHGGFTETGAGALSLTGASESWTRLDTGLGFAVSHVILTEAGRVTLDGRVLWEHAFAEMVPSQSLAFGGSPTAFEVLGPDAGRDRFRLGAGISFEATEDLTIRASYAGLFSGEQQSHGASVGLNVKF